MQPDKESARHLAGRKAKNAWLRTATFCQKSDLFAKTKIKEAQLTTRKKLFGVQYMDLLEQGCSDDVLQRCITMACDDLDALRLDITKLKSKLASVQDRTNDRLVWQPSDEEIDIAEESRRQYTPFQSDVFPDILDDDGERRRQGTNTNTLIDCAVGAMTSNENETQQWEHTRASYRVDESLYDYIVDDVVVVDDEGDGNVAATDPPPRNLPHQPSAPPSYFDTRS